MSNNQSKLEVMRHSAAHLLAAAVLELYPNTKFGVGPVIEYGFYYDFLFEKPVGEEELKKIEEKMREIQGRDEAFRREEMSIDEAIKFFEERGQIFKVELLRDLKEKGTTAVSADEAQEVNMSKPTVASIYWTGNFVDLCRGPHVVSTKEIGSFKLAKIAGAYWRGSEANQMLTRIYGLAFETENEINEHLKMLEETEKRDHRRLGKELKIFIFNDLVGPGLPLWLPNGTILADELEKLAKEMEGKAGYLRVRTPHVAKEEMYITSGHLPYYKEGMFPPMIMEEEDGKKVTYYLKAMNCPHHHQIYAAEPKSYRDLPFRLAEYGTCYRYEKSGELFGLMRVRSMQMNDAHIYCTEEQFASEFMAVIDLYLKYFKIFGIDKYVMRFSTHSTEGLGKKYIDNKALWEKTEEMVRRVMRDGNIPFVEVANEAAFYGPKIDVQVWSAIGKEFTLATNQVDFAVPARFGLVYKDNDGNDKTPICIHRAPLSTHERFIGFLIEHYAGAFPVWLAPVQASLISVGSNHIDISNQIGDYLREFGVRVNVDDANETVGNKIRKAEKQKVSYMIVIGDKEAEGLSLETFDQKDFVLRVRGVKDTVSMTGKQFKEKILDEIKNRK